MIRLGPAGSSGSGTLEGIKEVRKLGLDAMEVEFVRGVKMSIETAKEVGGLAKRLNIKLSIHAPYYINLASEEKAKQEASEKRILESCERGHYFGTKESPVSVVFHAGFYQGRDKEEIYSIIKEEVLKLQKIIKQKEWNVMLCPETTGKSSQFGDLDELIRLKKEAGCSICIDFAHLKARYAGKIDYRKIFEKIKHLKNIHCHFSGIEYTEKGERKHLITESKDIKELFDYIKRYRLDVTIINESPDPVGDSIKAKELR